MSHFTQTQTNLTELDRVLKAAKNLGFEVVQDQEGEQLYAMGFMEEKTEAIAVIKSGTRYDIGVVRNEEGKLEFTADWELIKKTGSVNQEEFQQQIQQQYALVTIQEMAEEQGLSMDEPQVAEDGSIEVAVSQW